MSVLLEALKKAAAEKKKGIDSSVDPIALSDDSTKDPETIVPSTLKLSVEDIAPVTASDEPLSSAVDDAKIDAPLKLTLSDMSASMSNQDDLASDISEPSVSLESADLVPEQTQDASETSAKASKQDQLNVVEPSAAQDALSQDLFQVTPSPLSDSELQQSLDASQSELNDMDKDSFEWSMNALPGYSAASVDDSPPIDKNSILLTGALTSEPKEKKKIHSTWLLVLMVALIFIGISVYGLIYYQKKSEELENSMRKFDLAKIQSTVHKKAAPVVAEVDGSLQTVKNSSSKSGSSPVVTTTDQSHAAEEAGANIASDNATSSVLNNELKTSALNVSKKDIVKPKTTHSSIKKKVALPITKPIYQPILVKVDHTKIILSEAYSAYEQGQLVLSQKKFSEILSIEPKNITAMIGLGGVAASIGQYELAMDYYQQALNIEPNNLAAYEAIANLSPSIKLNSDWNESLKSIATIYPNSAALQFALGNLSASSNDWLAAQENYFNAYALDMNNPDFAVNLAISLDQLGKYPLAGQYYTQALALAGSKKVNFNVTDIKNRLISIRQFLDQEK